MKKNITLWGIFGALLLTAGAISFFVFADFSQELESPLPLSGLVMSSALGEPVAPPDGYIKYNNEQYGFSFYHAPEAIITERKEKKGAMTILLENTEKVRGLQIFVLPYSKKEITETRFKKDVPTGVRTSVENTTIDGVPAVTFLSQNKSLGETREVWFIHRGYLFEVTTFKGVAQWFTPIMQSWKFF